MAAKIKTDYNMGYTDTKIDFMGLCTSKKEMMRLVFLPYLDLREVLNLSLSCKTLNSIIDPNRKETEYKSVMHLKLLASC